MDLEKIDALAKVIWDYHHLNQPLVKADCLLVLGSHDLRVADYASDLFLKGYAPDIIFSGGLGNLTQGVFSKPEADLFADVARGRGVPDKNIIIENQSTNTGENIIFTKKILVDQGRKFNKFILVQKPYMERRSYATFKKLWPEKEFVVTSPDILYEDYPNQLISKGELINIMVGDLQRIKIYPAKGFQIYQEIPDNVWQAYEKLVELGYTKHLVK